MTLNGFVEAGRRQIKDNKANPRWPVAIWALYLSMGLQWLWKDHPEAFVTDAIIVEAPESFTDKDGEKVIPVDDQSLEPLLHYACNLVIGEDREEAANGALSDAHLARAKDGV